MRSEDIHRLCEIIANDLHNVSAWERLDSAVTELVDSPFPDDHGAWNELQTLFKQYVWADIRDYWLAGVQDVPFTMYGPIPDASTRTASFDAQGMRSSLKDGAKVAYADFLSTHLRRGIVIGNSTSAGVGLARDGDTMASVLNARMSDTLWFNFSGGGHNLLQNGLTLDLLAPDRFDFLIVCAGLIDFLSPLSLIRTLNARIPAHLVPLQETETYLDIEKNGWSFEDINRVLLRSLETIAHRAALSGARPLFILQPHLGLSEKLLTAQERCMKAVYDKTALRPVWRAHTRISAYRPQIIQSLSAACTRVGMPFIDANQKDAFMANDWLYLDYIHVNGAGHARLADLAKQGIGDLV